MDLNRFFSSSSSLFFITLFVLGCANHKDKGDYKQTIKTCNHTYVEIYRTFGSGAFGSDLVDEYLTDTLNFRVYVGNSDEYYGGFYYHCSNDSLTIEKLHTSDSDSDTVCRTIESKTYDIKKLRALKNVSQATIEKINDSCLFDK